MSTEQIKSDINPNLKMYGGKCGGVIPLVILVGGLLWLAFSGPANPKSFWSIGFLAVAIGLLFARTKSEYCGALLRGLNDKNGIVIIALWIFASVFGQILQAGGLIEGLLWFGLNTGAQGSIFTVITFIAAMLFALGTGTGNGTILALTPVMYPAGVFLGANPLLLATAILSGGAFGDSFSPISASVITSAGTQGADMREVTRTRAPLVLTAAAISIVIFAIFGGGGQPTTPPELTNSLNPQGLLMLIPFAVVVVASLLGRHLIEALVYGSVLATILAEAIGKLTLSQIVHPVTKAGMSTGLIEDGVNGVVGAIIFILFVLAVIRVLIESGIMEVFVNWVQRLFIKSARQAEFAIVWITTLVTLPVSANVPCEVLLGTTFVKPISERFGITPERGANLLGCAVCTIFYMLPWHIVCALWYNTVSQTAAKFSIPSPSIQGAFAMPYGWALEAVIIVAALTGWGSKSATAKKTDPATAAVS